MTTTEPTTEAPPAGADDQPPVLDAEVVEDDELGPGTDVAVVPAAAVAKPQPIFPSASEFDHVMHMATALAKSNLVPASCRGKDGDVAIVLLTARDLGIPITQAFAKLYVIDGKMGMAAELMVALVRRAGHRIWCEELSKQGAIACGQRAGSEFVTRFEFTWQDAVDAQLSTKDNWKHYPKACLWARAASGLCRMEFPDVTCGLAYTPEELGDESWYEDETPATAATDDVKGELMTLIGELTEEQSTRLRATWKEWGVSPVSRLTEEEVGVARQLIRNATAIDAEGEDIPPTPPEPGASQPAPAAVATDTGASDAGAQAAPQSASANAEGSPSPDTAGQTGQADELPPHEESIVDTADVTGPTVFNGDTGHCSVCGGPIWYSAADTTQRTGTWQHCDDDDTKVCTHGSDPVLPAAEGVDVDALYAAAHGVATSVEQIEAAVAGLSHARIVAELQDAKQSTNGAPPALRKRLIAYRAAQVGLAT